MLVHGHSGKPRMCSRATPPLQCIYFLVICTHKVRMWRRRGYEETKHAGSNAYRARQAAPDATARHRTDEGRSLQAAPFCPFRGSKSATSHRAGPLPAPIDNALMIEL